MFKPIIPVPITYSYKFTRRYPEWLLNYGMYKNIYRHMDKQMDGQGHAIVHFLKMCIHSLL